MRYVAPLRGTVDPQVFDRLPLAAWHEFVELLQGEAWPTIEQLNRRLPADVSPRFVAQTPSLLADGLHYEQRIAECAAIATREANWHDLLNALIWLRYPAIKQVLNQRQLVDIAQIGPKSRSRAQYAMTHFDESGVIVTLRDPSLLALWDAHDWHCLFWKNRQAWLDGIIQVDLFGHALLEHALDPSVLLVGKALVFVASDDVDPIQVRRHCAAAISSGALLNDPLELRPLPLSGIPGWHPANDLESFHCNTACYQAKRTGREYPAPIYLSRACDRTADFSPPLRSPRRRRKTPPDQPVARR